MKNINGGFVALGAWVLVLSPAMLWSGIASADWTDDWLDQATTTPAGSYQSQQRGYYTGGSFQGRWRMTTDYPVTVNPPRLSVGCGGIDMFGGGFSYLDPEYLVEKFERIIQAAPAFAFQVAMTEYCKICENISNTMTAITDQLNSIQINDCRMAKRMVMSVPQDKNILKEMWSEAAGDFSLSEALKKNKQDMQEGARANGGKPEDDLQDMVADCPTLFKSVFTDGSILDNMASELGITAYAPMMRGLVGDASVTYSSANNVFIVDEMAPCSSNDQADASDILDGTIEVESAAGVCTAATFAGARELVGDRLQAIADKLSVGTGAVLSPAEQEFIERSPIPVFKVLSDSTMDGSVDVTVAVLQEPLALMYAHKMLDDLHRRIHYVIVKANEIETKTDTKAGGVAHKCDTTFVQQAIVKLRNMEPITSHYRDMARAAYARRMQEIAVTLQMSESYQEQRRALLNRNATGANK